jgi:hypothetical protein
VGKVAGHGVICGPVRRSLLGISLSIIRSIDARSFNIEGWILMLSLHALSLLKPLYIPNQQVHVYQCQTSPSQLVNSL